MQLLSLSTIIAAVALAASAASPPVSPADLVTSIQGSQDSTSATCLEYGTSCQPQYIGKGLPCCEGLTCVAIILGVGGWCW
ncbi:hypothetical protein A0H81_12613 [Grifola frondosa]|uniref:Uncharacterized protein n=1 Tax=Grifola frondosa TaxID=5627 RepID=A0A1C7LT44_GRIFR|nr:hypothetical protein A0H81_12613 [Grifola frondosa]